MAKLDQQGILQQLENIASQPSVVAELQRTNLLELARVTAELGEDAVANTLYSMVANSGAQATSEQLPSATLSQYQAAGRFLNQNCLNRVIAQYAEGDQATLALFGTHPKLSGAAVNKEAIATALSENDINGFLKIIAAKEAKLVLQSIVDATMHSDPSLLRSATKSGPRTQSEISALQQRKAELVNSILAEVKQITAKSTPPSWVKKEEGKVESSEIDKPSPPKRT